LIRCRSEKSGVLRPIQEIPDFPVYAWFTLVGFTGLTRLVQWQDYRPRSDAAMPKAFFLISFSMELPTELTSQATDCLHGDLPTLKTCSAVSHSFLPSARRHLFSNITLHRERLFEG